MRQRSWKRLATATFNGDELLSNHTEFSFFKFIERSVEEQALLFTELSLPEMGTRDLENVQFVSTAMIFDAEIY